MAFNSYENILDLYVVSRVLGKEKQAICTQVNFMIIDVYKEELPKPLTKC